MRRQAITIGEHELLLQDISNREKMRFQELYKERKGIEKVFDYILKNIIVKPQGLTLENFEISELNVLIEYIPDFLGYTKDATVLEVIPVTIDVIE